MRKSNEQGSFIVLVSLMFVILLAAVYLFGFFSVLIAISAISTFHTLINLTSSWFHAKFKLLLSLQQLHQTPQHLFHFLFSQ